MCAISFQPNAFYTTRNGSVVHTTKGPGSTIVGLIIRAPESSRRRFPVGTRVIYQNEMGHVLCGGNDKDHQDQCNLHELDAVDHFWSVIDKALLDKAKAKLKGTAGLVVMAHDEDAVEDKKVNEPTIVRFRDLKPGQKFRHPNQKGVFKKTNETPGAVGETVMVDAEDHSYRRVGDKFRTDPDGTCILVA
jgi:hypothetical protein